MKAKPAAKRTAVTTNVVHEINARGQHRLLVFKNGIPTASKWYEGHECGSFGQYLFHTDASSIVPTVYTARAVEHETLK